MDTKLFKEYKEYNYNINYDYVERLPKGWDLLPNIAIFEERSTKNNEGEELLSVTISRGVLLQNDIDNKKDNSNEDKSKYKLVKENDIVYNKMRMWQGSVGFSKYRGIVSPAYIVLKPRANIDPRFFHYQFRCDFYINYSKRSSYGLCDDQLNLRYKEFKRMYSIVPPLEIQKKIADKLEMIDKLIDIKIKKLEKICGNKLNRTSEKIENNLYSYIASQLITGKIDVNSVSNDRLYELING